MKSALNIIFDQPLPQNVRINEQLDQLRARFQQTNHEPPKLVIHRTSDSIVVANYKDHRAPKSRSMQKRGWNSPLDHKYRPYGEV